MERVRHSQGWERSENCEAIQAHYMYTMKRKIEESGCRFQASRLLYPLTRTHAQKGSGNVGPSEGSVATLHLLHNAERGDVDLNLPSAAMVEIHP